VRQRFGEFVLDLSRHQLLRDGHSVHLSPKAFELLALLVNRAPAAVSKDEIVRAVWPSVHVADASLTNVVAEIRAVTGDDARQPRFVRTVHAFGYAFSGELVREAPPVIGGAWHLVVAGRPGPRTDDGTWHIWVVDVDGGAPRRVTNDAGSQFMSAWSPDGRWLHFARLDDKGESVECR
jgi:DNA-binding winged helix-turn-helix (wHTH) protein